MSREAGEQNAIEDALAQFEDDLEAKNWDKAESLISRMKERGYDKEAAEMAKDYEIARFRV